MEKYLDFYFCRKSYFYIRSLILAEVSFFPERKLLESQPLFPVVSDYLVDYIFH